MKNAKNRNIFLLILNALIFLVAVVVMILKQLDLGGGFQPGGTYDPSTSATTVLSEFCFFTNDSNILSGAVSAVVVAFCIRNLVQKKDGFPRWLVMAQLVAASAVALTLVTVVVFLGPVFSVYYHTITMFIWMLSGTQTFFHLLSPLAAGVAFVYLKNDVKVTYKDCFFAIVPTAIYSVVYSLEVLFFKNWPDFYGLVLGNTDNWWAIFFVVPIILGATYLFAVVLAHFHNKTNAKLRVDAQ